MITEEQVYRETIKDLSGDNGEEQREAMMQRIMELQIGQTMDTLRIMGTNGARLVPDSDGGFLLSQKR